MTQDRISCNTIFEHTLCFGHVFRKILFQLSNCHKRKRKIDCVSCGRETMGTYVKEFYIKQYTKMETGWYDFHSTQIATRNFLMYNSKKLYLRYLSLLIWRLEHACKYPVIFYIWSNILSQFCEFHLADNLGEDMLTWKTKQITN